MNSLRRAAALLLPLLPALTTSLVLPAEQALRAPSQASSERPASRLPFVYEYSRPDAAASVRFALPLEAGDASLQEDPEVEPDVISVVISGTPAHGCADDTDTGIRVNGQRLVSSGSTHEDGLVLARTGWAGTGVDADGQRLDESLPAASWSLQCACLHAASSLLSTPSKSCEQIAYLLHYYLPTTADAEPDGFTLSFVQAPQPKLLRLSLALSVVEALTTTSRHMLAPLLQPIDTFIGHVPTFTLTQSLPKFSTTSALSFRTVTKHLAETATAEALLLHASASAKRTAAIPSTPTSEQLASPTAHTISDDLDDALMHDELDELYVTPSTADRVESFRQALADITSEEAPDASMFQVQMPGHDEEEFSSPNVKEFFLSAGRKAQKTLQTVLEQLVEAHNAYHQSSSVEIAASRNETRDLKEEDYIGIVTDRLAELPEISRAYLFTVCMFLFLAVASTIFACVHYSDPRRQAERAARREERINRRLYKKAACKQRFKNWLDRIRGREIYRPQSEIFARVQNHMRNPSHHSDLEWLEKEGSTAVTHVEVDPAGPSHDVHKEIKELRDAHGFVEGILRATSGMYHHYRSQKRSASRGTGHRRRYSDAGSEKSMLPPYTPEDDADFEDHIIVVDGLHFTARRRRVVTPASSIIDTSPRESDCGSIDGGK